MKSGPTLHVDNSNYDGVVAPATIRIDGINSAFTGLDLTGNSHTVQINQVGGQWAFVSEVIFGSNVPEPASRAMMIAGFGLVGATLRRL